MHEIRSLMPHSSHVQVSFEFFPPKTEEMEKALWAAVQALAPLLPQFISVTYGAGGTTRDRTHATVARLVRETSLKPAAHLTCVSASKTEVDEVARGYWEVGVRHIVALRGDPPAGVGTQFEPHPEGYQNTPDLIKGLKQIADFEISVSAYPEKHPESASIEADLDMLEAKMDAGATRAITQFFFENEYYYRYLDRVLARNISIPILPGIIPVLHFTQVAAFAKRAGTYVPPWLAKRFEGLEGDIETRRLLAAIIAAEQVLDLQAHGISHFHFYTLNKSELVYAICHLLGIRVRENVP